ncbi:MAG: diphthamide biosynthesis enzyme Dph2 [Candidatus Bathyarchaeia archaeon]
MQFKFETERVASTIRRRGAKRVMLQLPEGLKKYGVGLARELEAQTSAVIYVSCDPCYGACDLPLDEARLLNVDLIIHYGHSKFAFEETPNVIYVSAEANVDVEEVLKKALPLLEDHLRIGLATTIQHITQVNRMAELLKTAGKEVVIGEAAGHATHAGQVLGCDYATARRVDEKVDAFLYVGGGDFHPLGLALATDKPVVAADPYLNTAKSVSEQAQRIRKQRNAAMARLLQARHIGIIVCSKSHQAMPSAAEELKQRLDKDNRESVLLVLREITLEALDNFPNIEVFINTGCPRIGLDDSERYSRPIVNAAEAMIALSLEMEWKPRHVREEEGVRVCSVKAETSS